MTRITDLDIPFCGLGRGQVLLLANLHVSVSRTQLPRGAPRALNSCPQQYPANLQSPGSANRVFQIPSCATNAHRIISYVLIPQISVCGDEFPHHLNAIGIV